MVSCPFFLVAGSKACNTAVEKSKMNHNEQNVDNELHKYLY